MRTHGPSTGSTDRAVKAALGRRVGGFLRRGGNARLEISAANDEMPWLEKAGPPGVPESDFLADVVRALTGESGAADPLRAEDLDRLSWTRDATPRWPTLRRGRPASFVLLSPSNEGAVDPARARLVSVYIDGVEVRGGER